MASSQCSLVPRPRRKKKKSGLVSIVRACAIIYGIGSVNVSVNGLSHMPRSSTQAVYGTVSERTKKQTFYNYKCSKTACNHLSATIMVASYLMVKSRKHLSPDNSCELLDSQSQIWPSRLFSSNQDPRVELPLTFGHLSGEKPFYRLAESANSLPSSTIRK